jgi:hypothetical protein
MSFLKGFFAFLLLIICVFVLLFVHFAYTTFSMGHRDVKTDAIVVLGRRQGQG